MPAKRRHVALIVETSKAFGRGLLQGVARYVRSHADWSIYVDERAINEPAPAWLRKWEGDGVIARIQTPSLLDAVLRPKVPVVNTLRQLRDCDLPSVYADDRAAAVAAAEHLVERRFRHLAFVGVERATWSKVRCDAFLNHAAKSGLNCHVYSPLSRRRFSKSWEGGQDDLAQWIRDLPKPVGIMAAHDLRALCVLDACRRIDASIPEQVAIIGVDNDEVLCELADPPLTSVPHNFERIGYDAAELLDKLMDGAKPPNTPLLVPPMSVVTRRSTDIVAIDDPLVTDALRFIRERACEGIGVGEVASKVGVSRRALERAFQKSLDRSPHDEIVRLRLARIRQLLEETTFSLETIAAKTGFDHPAYLSVMFKNQTGQTPGEFRKSISRAEAVS